MSFTKLDSGITKSSLWSEPLHVRIVFISFLAEKNEYGFVSAARSGMIRLCNVTPEQFDEAERILSLPDEESKDPSFSGRRIEKIDGGWIVLNSDKYRLPEEEKKAIHKEYMKKWRDKKQNNFSQRFTEIHNDSPSVSVSNSLSESESDKKFSEDFAKFWCLYPRKEGKSASYKSWKKQKPILLLVLKTLSWQKQSDQWKKDNGQFIPMASTYINQRRWEDESVVETNSPIKVKTGWTPSQAVLDQREA